MLIGKQSRVDSFDEVQKAASEIKDFLNAQVNVRWKYFDVTMELEIKAHPLHASIRDSGNFTFSEDIARIFVEMQPGRFKVLERILEKHGMKTFIGAMELIASQKISTPNNML